MDQNDFQQHPLFLRRNMEFQHLSHKLVQTHTNPYKPCLWWILLNIGQRAPISPKYLLHAFNFTAPEGCITFLAIRPCCLREILPGATMGASVIILKSWSAFLMVSGSSGSSRSAAGSKGPSSLVTTGTPALARVSGTFFGWPKLAALHWPTFLGAVEVLSGLISESAGVGFFFFGGVLVSAAAGFLLLSLLMEFMSSGRPKAVNMYCQFGSSLNESQLHFNSCAAKNGAAASRKWMNIYLSINLSIYIYISVYAVSMSIYIPVNPFPSRKWMRINGDDYLSEMERA